MRRRADRGIGPAASTSRAPRRKDGRIQRISRWPRVASSDQTECAARDRPMILRDLLRGHGADHRAKRFSEIEPEDVAYALVRPAWKERASSVRNDSSAIGNLGLRRAGL